MSKKLSQDELLNKMKELEPNYDFSKFIYKDAKYKSTVICDKGHEYEVNWLDNKDKELNRIQEFLR